MSRNSGNQNVKMRIWPELKLIPTSATFGFTCFKISPQDVTTALAPQVNLIKQRWTAVSRDSCVGAKSVDPKAVYKLKAETRCLTTCDTVASSSPQCLPSPAWARPRWRLTAASHHRRLKYWKKLRGGAGEGGLHYLCCMKMRTPEGERAREKVNCASPALCHQGGKRLVPTVTVHDDCHIGAAW